MTIIVESGSTKADWIILHSNGEIEKVTTQGINPSTQEILMAIDGALRQSIAAAIEIYFYGAGVSNNLAKDRIHQWLQSMGAKGIINVQSDMMAACIACCNEKEGIVCILGTGSNSCAFDGEKIIDNIPSLGYILSDEGSGSHIGKEILRSYFYRQMTEDVKVNFEKHFHISKDDVIQAIYKDHLGSKYIASFASWLDKSNDQYQEKILFKVFNEFIEYRLLPLTRQFPNHPIHFVGSIAYHFQNHLVRSLNNYGLEASEILQKPIEKLIDFHQKNSNFGSEDNN